MKTYQLYIKSHNAFPDYDREIKADSENEAIGIFESLLYGEFDRDFIRANMQEVI